MNATPTTRTHDASVLHDSNVLTQSAACEKTLDKRMLSAIAASQHEEQKTTTTTPSIFKVAIIILIACSMFISLSVLASADPSGTIIITNSTVTAPTLSAGVMTTAGGSFTTLLLNSTTQTMRWKAYVGNVTGNFALRDPTNYTIYDWNIASAAGEVYASRNSSINWASIRCANNSLLQSEQNSLNITTTKEDSINRTFNNTVHKSFYIGTKLITNSSCRAIATYVNNTKQASTETATFQEILLDDTQSIVYSTILENKARGYNNQSFDFQMIVAESDINPTPSTYYFWTELS